MPISFACSGCAKRLKAGDDLTGRRVRRPSCGQVLLIPPAEEEAAAYLLQEEAKPPPPPVSLPISDGDAESASSPKPARRQRDVASLPPLTTNEPPFWLRHLHWLLVLALVPLMFSLWQTEHDREDLEMRIEETLDQAELSPEERDRIYGVLADEATSVDRLFALLPDRRLAGAFLPRDTVVHWALGAGAAVLFLAFFLLLGSHDTAAPAKLLVIGLFTGTLGIMFLFLIQTVAAWSQGVWFSGRGMVAIPLLIIKLIGFSYQAVLDRSNGFFLSFVGYTLGVGFCEEVCKAAALALVLSPPLRSALRSAFVCGLASGAGFGIAEGIIYAGRYYNGISGPGMYLVRFLSCVALHAVWTGSVAITINRKQGLLQGDMSWYEYLVPLFVFVGVPMVLHGLYDTLLKKEYNALALAVAVLSFVFLAYQLSRLLGKDDAAATRKMLREYRRRRTVVS